MLVARVLLEFFQVAHKIKKHDKDAGEAEKGEDHTRHGNSPHSCVSLPHNAITA
jgi:hypothetical protein